MDQGIEFLDAHTMFYIKGYGIWALGSKAKHETMRGQWGRELKDVKPARVFEIIQKNIPTKKKCIPQQSSIFQSKRRRRRRKAGRILETISGY